MRSPKRNEDRLTKAVEAWSNLRPTKSFAGLSLAEFKAAIQASLDARADIIAADDMSANAKVRRDNADAVSLPIADRVISGVLADAEEGNNGELYAAMGYVRKRDRASGLTRVRHVDDTSTPGTPSA